MSVIEKRLEMLAITLPPAPRPVASYGPVVIANGLAYVAGQVSRDGAGGITGKLGAGVSLERGQQAARLCGLFLIAQIKDAVGDLDRVKRVVKINGFVNVAPDFDAIPAVMNGCSDLLVEVFAEAGKHARSAVGVANLPFNFAVEADGVFELS